MIVTNKNHSSNESFPQKPPKLPIINTLHNYFNPNPSNSIQTPQNTFLFCSEHIYIYIFIDKIGITPFNEITPSDHRGSFLDLRLKSFLKKSYIALPDHSSRPLQSSNTNNVINYKRHLKYYVVNHRIIEHADELQKKLINNSITSTDRIINNKLDVLLTKGMIKAERVIKNTVPSFLGHLNLQSLS